MFKTIGRAAIFGAALWIGLGTAVVAVAGPTIVRFATVDGEGNLLKFPYYAYTEVFSSDLEAATHGRYKVETFPNGQLGKLDSLLEQNIRGSIQIVGGVSAGQLAPYDPVASVLELPYSFPSLAVARRVMQGPYGQQLSDQIAKKVGVRILSYLPDAFRNFSTSNKLIKSPADMKGLKIRVQDIPTHIAMVKALGASPTPIAWSELYSALQTGVVDGEENAPYTMLMANLQEVQKYYTLDHHLINMPLITINEQFYQGLSNADKTAFRDAARNAAFAMMGIITATQAEDMKKLKSAGMTIYKPTPAQYEEFVKLARGPVEKIVAAKIGHKPIDALENAIAKAEKQLAE